MKSERKKFVIVKDRAGNEFVCRFDALMDPKHVKEEELRQCLDDAKEALATDFSAVSVRED
ncbi:MAG: hypothetical protein WCA08_08930 [Desulfoferrobacter sp.]